MARRRPPPLRRRSSPASSRQLRRSVPATRCGWKRTLRPGGGGVVVQFGRLGDEYHQGIEIAWDAFDVDRRAVAPTSSAARHNAVTSSAQAPASSTMPMARGDTSDRCDSRTHSSMKSRAGVRCWGIDASPKSLPGKVAGRYTCHRWVSFIRTLGKSSSGSGAARSGSALRQSHG